MSKKKAVAFVLLLWLLSIILVASAKASTHLDALKVSWYLKGEGDDALGSMGMIIQAQACHPTATKYVLCTNRIQTPQKALLCSRGRFYLLGFAVTGQWATPKPCAPSS